MSHNAFAVHLVTHNNSATIRLCLESLEAQSESFSLYIVDNASEDDTLDILRAMGYEAYCNPTNLGYACAHNLAIRLSTEPYILTLNPDVRLMPDFLRRMRETLDTNHDLGSANGCLLRVDSLDDFHDSRIDSTGFYIQRSRHQRLRGEGQPDKRRDQFPASIFAPDGAAAVYRRAMLLDIAIHGEIFDEDFFIQKEDVDVGWRARWRGWESLYVRDAVAYHIRAFRPGQRRAVAAKQRYYGVRNRYLLIMKNDSRWLLRRDVAYVLWYELKILTYLLLFERESFTAVLEAWRLRRVMAKKQAHIRACRRVTPQAMGEWIL